MKTTGDQQLLKRINRSVLLRLLRVQPGQSRARLANTSGLTKSTVSALVRELLDEHWLSEASAPVAADGLGPAVHAAAHQRQGPCAAGRGDRRAAAAPGVGLAGRPRCSTPGRCRLEKPEVPRCAARQLHLVHQAWQTLAAQGLALSGVGVCLPGAVDEDAGLVRFAPNLGWRDVPFFALLKQAMCASGLPVADLHLHNDADAAALGEYEFADSAGSGALIFVNCDVGVGAGIVLNDHLFTGARGMAGEIGHSILQVGGALCSCGRRGCAETFIGARALGRPVVCSGAARHSVC